MMYILGISAYYHDSAACLVNNGKIIAAAQEERFSRKKHDANFPRNAVNYCLKEGKVKIKDINYIVFYDKPLLKFGRLLASYIGYAPRGFNSFLSSMSLWCRKKLYFKKLLKNELCSLTGCLQSELPTFLFTEHHHSHAASAFYPSPFERAAVICLDAVGEWATTSVWLGEGNKLIPQWQINFPHSLGMLYSAFTHFTGFKVNSGEYKLMGLAPYGEPRYKKIILDNLLDLKEDGTFRLNMRYFDYVAGFTMTNRKFDTLFGGPRRESESPITQREMDIARSIQVVIEEAVLRLVQTVHKETGLENVCLAGGVALNCVANGRILREGPFKDIWIQPAAGDAGGALGAALAVWHQYLQKPREVKNSDSMQGSYLGPSFTDSEIRNYLDSIGAKYSYLADHNLMPLAAELLNKGKTLGWFQGRMEFGPRALGGRSILGDSRNPKMQSLMNLKIKYRESFRPFAPSVLAERVSDYFEFVGSSPYMLLVAPVKEKIRLPMTEKYQRLFGIEKLKVPRSKIPAVTHVNYSARIQTVDNNSNPRYYALLKHFEDRVGCPVLINTSFNVRGEPIVCTPDDAYRCFMRTEMDYLVMENFLLAKVEQPEWKKDNSWKKEFVLD
ncbi:carbamoyltransferase [Candidatus Margulisiibacteriota bacterium]